MSSEARTFLALLESAKPPFGDPSVSPAQVREIISQRPPAPYDPVEVGRIEDRILPGADGGRPARIYWPTSQVEGEALPVVMYIHGGGWVLNTLDTYDPLLRNLCSMAEVIVVSTHPRYADEAPFPAPLEDCYSALLWTAANAAELGGDPDRIAIAGESSGGNLAAATAQLARDRGGPALVHQLLVYPVICNDFGTASYAENGSGYFVTTEDMRWFWKHYIGDPDDDADPYAAPSLAATLSGLPPARVVTAEYDPLRDEGEEYAALLEAAGVLVSAERYPGMFHGFFTQPHLFGGAQKANEAEFAALKGAMQGGGER
jgi:acetyl esterase